MRKVLILGCGASGLAMARFLFSRGWSVTVADSRENPPGLGTLKKDCPSAVFHGGRLAEESLGDAALVCISPGLSPEHSDAAGVVAQARAAGVPVVGEIELFARELARLKAEKGYCPVVCGITGTNGKTTTTTLVTHMLRESGRTAVAAGNIGPNALTELGKAEEENRLPDAWVLELSSFQLWSTESLSCTAAAYLNLTEDHIDWHGSMAEYGRCKAKVFSPDTQAVFNRQDPATQEAACGRHAQSFGTDAPQGPGQWGLVTTEEGVCLAVWDEEAGAARAFLPVREMRLRGLHNAMNALAACAVAVAAGAPLEACVRTLRSFEGLPHRVQSVLSAGGIEFIDDSKGTNVGAVIAALEGLAALGMKSSILLGGDGKGQDFAPLSASVARCCRAVTIVGRDGPLIEKALEGSGVPVTDAYYDFDEAVRLAWHAARPGDAVLLSPACASWDMFRSYKERAERFAKVAREIARGQGV